VPFTILSVEHHYPVEAFWGWEEITPKWVFKTYLIQKNGPAARVKHKEHILY
jgi:hypothetical protein